MAGGGGMYMSVGMGTTTLVLVVPALLPLPVTDDELLLLSLLLLPLLLVLLVVDFIDIMVELGGPVTVVAAVDNWSLLSNTLPSILVTVPRSVSVMFINQR